MCGGMEFIWKRLEIEIEMQSEGDMVWNFALVAWTMAVV